MSGVCTWSGGVPGLGGVPGPGGYLVWGVYLVLGVYLVWGCTWSRRYLVWGAVPGPRWVYLPRCSPLWTELLTHASENITLPQTSFVGGNKQLYLHGDIYLIIETRPVQVNNMTSCLVGSEGILV